MRALAGGIRVLLQEYEENPGQDDWMREPHGYLLKPDFKRTEQKRSQYDTLVLSVDELVVPTHETAVHHTRKGGLVANVAERVQRSFTNNAKNYNRRYFRLEEDAKKKSKQLVYYRTVTDRSRLGAIELKQIERVQLSRIPDAPEHAVDLVARDRVYTIAADTRLDLARWTAAICRALRNERTNTISEAPHWKHFEDLYYDAKDGPIQLELRQVISSAVSLHHEALHMRSLRTPSPAGSAHFFKKNSSSSDSEPAHSAYEKNMTRPNSSSKKKWFALVTGVSGAVQEHGLIRPHDILLGINDVAFCDLDDFDDALKSIQDAKLPLRLNLIRDVGWRVAAEGWAKINGRLRYLELTRASLCGTRPVPGGFLASALDFGYDIISVSRIDFICPSMSTHCTTPSGSQYVKRKRQQQFCVCIELNNDPTDILCLELRSEAEARSWANSLWNIQHQVTSPKSTSSRGGVPFTQQTSFTDGEGLEVSNTLSGSPDALPIKLTANQHTANPSADTVLSPTSGNPRQRRRSLPSLPSPQRSDHSQRSPGASPTSMFSSRMTSPFRKFSKPSVDLAAAAAAVQAELARGQLQEDYDHDALLMLPVAGQGLENQLSPFDYSSREALDPNFGPVLKMQLPVHRFLSTGNADETSVNYFEMNELTCFLAVLREYTSSPPKCMRSRRLLFVLGDDGILLYFSTTNQSDDAETALGELSVAGARIEYQTARFDATALQEDDDTMHKFEKPAYCRIRLAVDDSLIDLVFDTLSDHDADHCATLLADLAQPVIPRELKQDESSTILGELRLRVAPEDSWTQCFATISKHEIKLYATASKTSPPPLLRNSIRLMSLMSIRLLSDIPHRFELEVDDEQAKTHIIYRFEAATISAASSIVGAITFATQLASTSRDGAVPQLATAASSSSHHSTTSSRSTTRN